MNHSVIIKNGIILDGTGNPPFHSDIVIEKDKIFKTEKVSNDGADLTIDATGLYIAPGFIDLTTHSDNHWTLFSQPRQESFIRQGVTTIIGGHGGFSLSPFFKKDASAFIFERWAEKEKENVNWQTTKEFLEEVKRRNLAVNFGTFVGHKTLRKNVVFDETKIATKGEIREINQLLEKSLEEGAFGLSTNLPLFGKNQAKEELLVLLKTIRKNKAISSHHLQDEGKNVLPIIAQLVGLLRESGSRGHISHFKVLGRASWKNFKNATQMIELAQQEGAQITCDFFPYTSTGSNLFSLLPAWLLEEKKEKILEFLKDKNIREELAGHLKKLTLHYDRIIVASTALNVGSAGKSISDISKDFEMSEEETILDLLAINNLQVSIFNNVIAEENIADLAKKPYAAVSSDGVGYDILNFKNDLPHPRSFGSFPKVFFDLVKNKELLSWEDAVCKMSGLPAEILGLKGRGLIKKGNYADIVVFNPKLIRDRATYETPFYPEGIQYVFVNGSLTLAENVFQEKNNGVVMKKE